MAFSSAIPTAIPSADTPPTSPAIPEATSPAMAFARSTVFDGPDDVCYVPLTTTETPRDLVVRGNLSLARSQLRKIGKGLVVTGNLDLSRCTELESIPAICVLGDLLVYGCTALREISDEIRVEKNIVFAKKEFMCPALRRLPNICWRNKVLDLRGCVSLQTLPEGMHLRYLNLEACSGLRSLPSVLYVSRVRLGNKPGVRWPESAVVYEEFHSGAERVVSLRECLETYCFPVRCEDFFMHLHVFAPHRYEEAYSRRVFDSMPAEERKVFFRFARSAVRETLEFVRAGRHKTAVVRLVAIRLLDVLAYFAVPDLGARVFAYVAKAKRGNCVYRLLAAQSVFFAAMCHDAKYRVTEEEYKFCKAHPKVVPQAYHAAVTGTWEKKWSTVLDFARFFVRREKYVCSLFERSLRELDSATALECIEFLDSNDSVLNERTREAHAPLHLEEAKFYTMLESDYEAIWDGQERSAVRSEPVVKYSAWEVDATTKSAELAAGCVRLKRTGEPQGTKQPLEYYGVAWFRNGFFIAPDGLPVREALIRRLRGGCDARKGRAGRTTQDD